MHIILGQWSPARMRKKRIDLKTYNTSIRRKGLLSSKVDYILLSWGDMVRTQCIFGSSPSQMGACTACFSFDLAWLSYHRKNYDFPYHIFPMIYIFTEFHWSGLPFPSPGDLPNPGIKPRSSALRADALPSEPPGNPSLHFTLSHWLH